MIIHKLRPVLDVSTWVSTTDDYNEFDMKNLKMENPVIENLVGSGNDFLIGQYVVDETHVCDNSGNVTTADLFFKHAPLYDPIHYMIGAYTDEKKQNKLNDVHNASYVDYMAYLFLGKLYDDYGFIHSLKYYGSFTSTQGKYRMNILDDLDYIQEHDYFHKNLTKLFHTNILSYQKTNFKNESNKNRPQLTIEDDVPLEITEEPMLESESITQTVVESGMHEVDLDNLIGEEKFEINIPTNGSDSDTEDSDNDESEDEDEEQDESRWSDMQSDSDDDTNTDDEPLYAYIYDFPVQTVVLERCKDTLDKLFQTAQIDKNSGRAAMFQVIASLLVFQKAFQLTHNDLHTNNIMYIETDKEFITYRIKGNLYRVPTYGRIYKIIDFGRAIYRVGDHLFCSDSFAPSGDGDGQYNTEPFFNPEKKRLDPNYSFDLCRLGCSIYDFVIPDGLEKHDMDEFQELIMEWCHDDKNKNVLYKRNGEERYPDFKLYKMIARTVTKHTPENQLNREFFKEYLVDACDDEIIDLDRIERYSSL